MKPRPDQETTEDLETIKDQEAAITEKSGVTHQPDKAMEHETIVARSRSGCTIVLKCIGECDESTQDEKNR